MGRSKDQWIADYERLGEDYASGDIDVEQFETGMIKLGFSAEEISEHKAALDEDRG